ncbi:hypothetical protein F4777DRAFT_578241 [Nemania sp. FL0916]|nr:hypothetical protein F4777DRAFT_578241 [Nemania sp. FL0916]
MAAPASKTTADLSGKWTLNKTLSDPTDPALALQGIGWLVRKGIGAATITITVKQTRNADGAARIDIDQSASGLSSTHEARVLTWTEREHKDWLFGKVRGRSKFISLADLNALIAPGGEARTEGWVDDSGFLAQDWLTGDEEGDAGLVISHVAAEAGWFATQIWGFQDVGGERRHVRNVTVSKGETYINFKMIYDFVSESTE